MFPLGAAAPFSAWSGCTDKSRKLDRTNGGGGCGRSLAAPVLCGVEVLSQPSRYGIGISTDVFLPDRLCFYLRKRGQRLIVLTIKREPPDQADSSRSPTRNRIWTSGSWID